MIARKNNVAWLRGFQENLFPCEEMSSLPGRAPGDSPLPLLGNHSLASSAHLKAMQYISQMELLIACM